jgi:hypothetical protein
VVRPRVLATVFLSLMNYEVLGSILHPGDREGGRQREGEGEGEGENVCVCVCVCVCAPTLMHACAHMFLCRDTSMTIHIEARGQPWELLPQVLSTLFLI